MIKAIILRFFVVFVAGMAVVMLMPGIFFRSPMIAAATIFLIAGFNAILKIFLTYLSVGCSILWLGPILLIANTMALWVVRWLPLGFKVDSFWTAVWAGLAISVVSFVMDFLVSDGL
ncbi:MAG: Mycobacterial 4 phage holin, superfamily [Chloroflexi bacterium]|jgi:putative membrane protein|nr:Mycobacterial 4 phage holin, superfamily [Chloroflexota bacterium]